ncbi:DMT family transporter [Niallia sp. FSL R7-0648]|uniref:DMT family transporter n=1 Tax=Niallia sp. FSL R7-0648 TaxID=2954521 RepID=UPI004046D34D
MRELVISLIIDHYGWFNSMVIPLDTNRLLAAIFMMIALYFIYKGNKIGKTEPSTKTLNNEVS